MAQSHHQVNIMEREGSKGGSEEKVGVVDKNRQETSQKNALCVRILVSTTGYKRHVGNRTGYLNMGSVLGRVR